MLRSKNLVTRQRISVTRDLPNPTEYVQLLQGEYAPWAFDEMRAPTFRGKWRAEFQVSEQTPIDLEIGTGNGFFFAHRSAQNPQRCLVGIELKYKPLIQSIKRALRGGAEKVRIVRFDASAPDELFDREEINDVFIHFPDPWEKKKKWKHRLIQTEFLDVMFDLQRPGSRLEFKTDSLDYFEWSVERFKQSRYQTEALTHDLHSSEWASRNFVTHFEKLWTSKGIKINYANLYRP